MPKRIPLATRRTSRRGDQLFRGCEYSEEEVEFLRAIDRYKRERNRPHPAWTEVLAVFKALGYRKTSGDPQ